MTIRYRFTICTAVVGFVMCGVAAAQEQSVKPGINDNFQDPNAKRYTIMFEGESRAIFKHRQEIVEALELENGMAVADVGAGTGFFAMMITDRAGDDGKVFAVDIAESFIEHEALNEIRNGSKPERKTRSPNTRKTHESQCRRSLQGLDRKF